MNLLDKIIYIFNFKNMPLKELWRTTTHSCKHLELGTIQLGWWKLYEFTGRVGWKNAVAWLVTHTENQTQIFIEQYRYPVKARVLELVAWLIDKPWVSQEQIMREEVEEEIWYKDILNLEFLWTTAWSPWMSTELTYLYDIEISWERWSQNLWDMEDIEIIEIPIMDVDKFIKFESKRWTIINPNVWHALTLVWDKYKKILK